MRKRLISKIIAIALTAMMTTCLTACEVERDIPVYGTGIESEADTSVRHNLSPTAPVETEPVAPVEAYIKSAIVNYDETFGEYISVYVVVTNNTGETRTIGSLIGISIPGMSYITENITGEEAGDPMRKIKNGEQALRVYSYAIDDYPVEDPVDITVYAYINGDERGDDLDAHRFYLTEE